MSFIYMLVGEAPILYRYPRVGGRVREPPECLPWERKRRSVAKAVHCPSPINDRNSDSLDWKLAISLKKHEGNPFLVE